MRCQDKLNENVLFGEKKAFTSAHIYIRHKCSSARKVPDVEKWSATQFVLNMQTVFK
jgi:hypothetical protein